MINNRISVKKDRHTERLHAVADQRYSLEVVTTESGFDAMREAWNELSDHANVPVYMRYLWISLWWKYFGRHPKRSLCIVTVFFYDQLVGIAPFYLGKSSLGDFTLERRLKMMGTGTTGNEFLGFVNDYGYSDFLDIIAHENHREQVAVQLTSWFIKNEMGVDGVSLNHIPDSSFILNEWLPLLQKSGLIIESDVSDYCPYLQVPDSLSSYLAGLRSSVRRRFQQASRALSDKGPLVVRDASDPADIDKAMDQLIKLHQFRWNRLGYPGLFFDKRFRAFLRDYVIQALQENGIWLQLVEQDGRCYAARLALKDKHSYYDYISGFNDDSLSSRQRPGLGLMLKLLEDASRQSISTIEFLRGDEEYKFEFTSDIRKNRHIRIHWAAPTSLVMRSFRKLLQWAGKGHLILETELKLIRFHIVKSGFVKMPRSYFSFRWNTVKIKIKNRE